MHLAQKVLAVSMATTSLGLALALAITTAAGATAAKTAAPAAKAVAPASSGQQLRLNQLQVVGTHNSYHQEATPAEEALRGLFDASGEKALEYGQPRLSTQFGAEKIRQIELDVWADPAGGLYAHPLLRTLTLGGPYDPVMSQPGTKVLHIQEVDYRSSCLTFRRCLRAVKLWSDTHPSHLPIAILVEFKDDPLPVTLPVTFPAPLPWTTARMDTVDADIRSVFTPRSLITPDDVRGDAATLESAVLTRGWPTLAQSRGKVLFLMDNDGAYRTSYLAGHPSLRGRVLFSHSTPGQPDAAFVEENDPTGANQARIQDEVRRGYVVRTRADVDTAQARTGDTTMRDAALASGAQWVSTDYPVKGLSARFGTHYVVQLPGDVAARCTPIAPANAPAPCTASALG
jgi:hypothetical protein